MAALIEDYAIIGSTTTVALVAKDGSIDWWCVPRIDAGACFAALLGGPEHGRWLVAPKGEVQATSRRYRTDTLVLETEYRTADGTVAVVDFQVPGPVNPTIFRVVEGRSGTVAMRLELVVRFDYGSIVPWVRATGDGLTLVAGNDALRFHSPVPLDERDHTAVAEFTVGAGEHLGFSLGWYSALADPPLPVDARAALETTQAWWHEWVGRCTYQGAWRDDIVRSLITLKALTYAPTGAIVAAATTSLPERIGGVRNWDYRYSWLRDATYTLQALLMTGYRDEATAWAAWLRRAVAGRPGDFQIMYSIDGNRRLTELELDWLPGYEGSKPVRVGNQASEQLQLDVFGEVMDASLTGMRAGLRPRAGYGDEMIPGILEHLEVIWEQPDDGIWEIRGPRRQFVHSKVMCWVAFDRAVRIARLGGWTHLPVERWSAVRDRIHEQVCREGWNEDKQSFVQYYGADQLDASLLTLAPVGFLPPTDPRLATTVEAIQRELTVDGFVQRYPTGGADAVDGLPPGEGAFLMTTFWLADNLALLGRRDEALEIFERLRSLRNDVGLYAEEYDPTAKRMLGNFPQAFSHLAFITTAMHLALGDAGPVAARSSGG